MNHPASHPVVTLADVVRLLDRRYPPGTAETWDRVGLVAGDPDQPVRRILLAVDPVAAVVDEAVAWGADLVVVHHPLLLRGVHSVAATTAKGALLHRLTRAGVALYTAHTNADGATGGVADELARLLDLRGTRPLVPAPAEALDKHVVLVPAADAERMVDALAAAGAGALGDYRRCAWTTTGEGTFTPTEAATPSIGRAGEAAHVVEARVEMVAPRRLRTAVVAAMHGAHPYEEPAFDVLELARRDGPTGTGRVGHLAEPLTLHAFAERVAAVLPATVQGIRYAGPPDATVRTVAVVGGSGDSLFDAVRAAAADVYLTADLRHHPASELRERAEFEARGTAASPPYLVDAAHFASEWPWLAGAERDLRADLAALSPGDLVDPVDPGDPGATGAAGAPRAASTGRTTTVQTRVSTLCTDPWTGRVPAPSASSEGLLS